jgi:hypothetical protein
MLKQLLVATLTAALFAQGIVHAAAPARATEFANDGGDATADVVVTAGSHGEHAPLLSREVQGFGYQREIQGPGYQPGLAQHARSNKGVIILVVVLGAIAVVLALTLRGA